MNIKDITQLYYITDIANLPSILKKGILSFNQAAKIDHKSIAEEGVQERRKKKYRGQIIICMIMPIYILMLIIQCLALEDT